MNEVAMALIAMIGAHAFFDYAGQGDFMSKAKNSASPIPGVPWRTILANHCAMHGAAVALITGVWWLFVAEFVIHWVTDDAKCRGWIGFNLDQAIHISCKVTWVVIAFWVGAL